MSIKPSSKSITYFLIPVLLIVITGLIYYTSSQPRPQEQIPADEWMVVSPETENMDSSQLQDMMDLITEQDLPVNSVIIVRNGRIVKEEYPSATIGPDTKRKLYSATKSVTSALIGIAIHEGFIEGVEQKITDFFPDLTMSGADDLKQYITIEHLLTMTPGYQWSMGDGGRMRATADPAQYVLDKPMVNPPGTVYNYGDGAPLLLSAVLKEATGKTTLEFATEYLFDPLNITDVYWESRGDQYFAASGLHLTPRDIAKLGYLFLNDGAWRGNQVIPKEWVETSTTSHISGSGYIAGNEYYVDGYGYLWWVLPQSGVYYASGMYEQRIYVCPELDLVAVFTSNNSGNDVTTGLMHRYILAACDGYTKTLYDEHGVSFYYPRGMSLIEAPYPGTETVSDVSGFIQMRTDYPYESLTLMWYPVEGATDLEAEIDTLFSMFESEATSFERGRYQSSEINGQEMVSLSANVTENGYVTSGVVGCWLSADSDRVIIYYYITDPEIFTQDEIQGEFFEHLSSINAH